MKNLLDYTLAFQSSIEYSDCLQASVNTIINNIGDRPEFMPFLTFSNFNINNLDLSSCFSRSGKIQGIPDELASLTGICAKKRQFIFKTELFEQCLINTQKQIPTVINIDTFFLPYHLAYQKEHLGHYVIILSLDVLEHCVYMDPFFNLSRVDINFYDLPLLYEHYFVYTVDYKYKRSVQEIVKEQLNEYIQKEFTRKIENVSVLMMTEGKLKSELKDYEVTVLSPFVLRLKCFTIERKNLLHCLYRYFPEEDSLIKTFELCVKDWSDAYLILLKCISRNFEKHIIEKASEFLINAIKREETAILKLKHIVEEKQLFD